MKIIDQYYTCKMPGLEGSAWQLQCHLRIFQSHTNVHTVMISDMGFEIGWFNPLVVENLVNQIVQEFRLNAAKLVWLEHYAADYRELTDTAFSQVAFEWRYGKAHNPQWLTIAPEVAQALVSDKFQLPSTQIMRYA